MTYQTRPDADAVTADLAALMGWLRSAPPWGELSFDQADGFAPAVDGDLPSDDLNDDRGYGFGV